MEKYRFHFNEQLASDLRRAVNDRPKQSVDNTHSERETKGQYLAWNRTCAAMDRLQDTLRYINCMQLGGDSYGRTAFDFYDFINSTYVIIDCIKTLGHIFRIDDGLIGDVEKATDVFTKPVATECGDGRYFEYIRSLCSVHPLCTNHQQEFLSGSQFHCCPRVYWQEIYKQESGTWERLTARIYTSQKGYHYLFIELLVPQFEEYLNRWLSLIPKVIEAKNAYTDSIYEEFRKKSLKSSEDFKGDCIAYLKYLKKEYCDRFDDSSEYIFDGYIRVFSVQLSDLRNSASLEKYKNAILYSLEFLKNEMLNMSTEGFENTGIEHPDRNTETTLFCELHNPLSSNGVFDNYSYELGKVSYLEDDEYCSEFDKEYARRLLEDILEPINQYVVFTGDEPDDEMVVLVSLALYLDSLTTKNIINRNIPNDLKYRTTLLTDSELESILQEEPLDEESSGHSLEEFLKLYGG